MRVDRGAGRFAGLQFWESEFDLRASAATAKKAQLMAAELDAFTIGEPQILEMMFDKRASATGK